MTNVKGSVNIVVIDIILNLLIVVVVIAIVIAIVNETKASIKEKKKNKIKREKEIERKNIANELKQNYINNVQNKYKNYDYEKIRKIYYFACILSNEEFAYQQELNRKRCNHEAVYARHNEDWHIAHFALKELFGNEATIRSDCVDFDINFLKKKLNTNDAYKLSFKNNSKDWYAYYEQLYNNKFK